jgi:alpha-L-fucosidase 2
MKTTKSFAIIILCFCFYSGCCKKEFSGNNRLWYTYPARYWDSQALHLGNGYFGVSFFGGIEEEIIAVSEASMWTGEAARGNWINAGVNPKASKSLPDIREAIVNGKIRLADSLVSENFLGASTLHGSFTSVGNLKINFLDQGMKTKKYVRSLDLANSLGLVQYDVNDIAFNREYFCSYPDRILGMRFSADKPGNISFNLEMSIVQDSFRIEISKNRYHIKGFINENNRPFSVMISVENKGGTVGQENGYISVRNSDSVEIYLSVATDYALRYPNYTGIDPVKTTNDILRNLSEYDYEELKNRHIEDYKSLYDRVALFLEGNKEAEKLPTNERFEKLKAGKSYPGYKVLAFNLGRYMIISSSRPHTLPANLQGVWNIFRSAPWLGNYQSNINLQQNYWSCGPVGLNECQQPYIDWIENLAISGHEIARRVYGTDGWVSHTTGNIWGHAAPIGSIVWGLFPMGAAWHCQHVWEQFAFTQDTVYLRNQAFPLLRDASVFWLENLIPFNGYLISAPTVSADHGAYLTDDGYNPAVYPFKSDKYHYCLPGAYQDIQMVWDLFTNTSTAAKILGFVDFADSLIVTREKLLPLKIGRHGQLQEWNEDIDNPECKHRHISHLYAVYPGTEIHPLATPDLADAAKKALDMRGDGRFFSIHHTQGGTSQEHIVCGAGQDCSMGTEPIKL